MKDLRVPISHPEEPQLDCLVYTFFKPSPQDMFADLRERETPVGCLLYVPLLETEHAT